MILNEIIRFLVFILIGVCNTAVDLGIFWILINTFGKLTFWANTWLKPAAVFNVFSFGTAIFFSFWLNSNITFKDSTKVQPSFGLYLFISLISLVAASSILQFATDNRYYQAFHKHFWQNLTKKIKFLANFQFTERYWWVLVKLFTVALTLVINFFGYKLFVF